MTEPIAQPEITFKVVKVEGVNLFDLFINGKQILDMESRDEVTNKIEDEMEFFPYA